MASARAASRRRRTGANGAGELSAVARALREQADTARRRSPIEVVLGALTSRRLPRKT
jgi:hypothetical protein